MEDKKIQILLTTIHHKHEIYLFLIEKIKKEYLGDGDSSEP